MSSQKGTTKTAAELKKIHAEKLLRTNPELRKVMDTLILRAEIGNTIEAVDIRTFRDKSDGPTEMQVRYIFQTLLGFEVVNDGMYCRIHFAGAPYDLF